jgi:branched-chain amino acid transport system substrate-binding protein
LSGALTGGDAILGQTQREGVQLAVDEINAAGGIQGHQIDLITEDEANDPSRMAQIAQKFINVDHVDAILGGTNDGTAVVLAQTAESANVPLVVPFANGNQITAGRKWAFQVDVASSSFVQGIVTYDAKAYKKICITYDNNGFGQEDRDLAVSDLKALNVTPAAVVELPNEGQDYTPQLQQLQSAGCEVTISPDSGTNVAQLRKNMVQLGYEPVITGPNSLAFQSMIDVGQNFVEHKVFFMDLIDASKPAVIDFQSKFTARFGSPATSGFELLGYDAMKVLAAALEKGWPDKTKVRDALEGLQNFALVSGGTDSTLSYSATVHNRPTPSDLVWRWVDKGAFANAPIPFPTQ